MDSTSLQNVFFGNSVLLGTLSRLGAKGEVRVYVPEIVIQEIRSQHIERISEAVRNLDKGLTALLDFAPSDPSFAEASKLVKGGVERLRSDLEDRIQNWIKEARVVSVPIAHTHGPRVLSRYFSGGAPFRQIKNRSDFPDAFVWEAVLDAIGTSSGFHFVTNDAGFESGVNELGGRLVTHKDLQTLFEAGSLPITVTQADRDLAQSLRKDLSSLEDQIRQVIHSQLPHRTLPLPRGIAPEGEDSPFTIEHVLALKDVLLAPESIALLGNFTYVLRFSAGATVRASYESRAGWQQKTFNLSEGSSIRADYDTLITGSLTIRFSVGTENGRTSTQTDLDEVTLVECTPATPVTDDGKSDRVTIQADVRELDRVASTARGVVVVTGRYRVRRLRAASTLLNNVAAAHPDSLLLSGHGYYDVPSIGFVRPVDHASFRSIQDFADSVDALEPSGISCELESALALEAASSLDWENRIIIVVTEAHQPDDVSDHIYAVWRNPVIVTAT